MCYTHAQALHSGEAIHAEDLANSSCSDRQRTRHSSKPTGTTYTTWTMHTDICVFTIYNT